MQRVTAQIQLVKSSTWHSYTGNPHWEKNITFHCRSPNKILKLSSSVFDLVKTWTSLYSSWVELRMWIHALLCTVLKNLVQFGGYRQALTLNYQFQTWEVLTRWLCNQYSLNARHRCRQARVKTHKHRLIVMSDNVVQQPHNYSVYWVPVLDVDGLLHHRKRRKTCFEIQPLPVFIYFPLPVAREYRPIWREGAIAFFSECTHARACTHQHTPTHARTQVKTIDAPYWVDKQCAILHRPRLCWFVFIFFHFRRLRWVHPNKHAQIVPCVFTIPAHTCTYLGRPALRRVTDRALSLQDSDALRSSSNDLTHSKGSWFRLGSEHLQHRTHVFLPGHTYRLCEASCSPCLSHDHHQ